ncbi:zinc finger protein 91-like [Phlebotomus argentipes]|uniref:zinc finger protein 91-like n=1 Tax=Phlebotomus argentipes TaxID=94469 RepID=UPI0028935703|nr:zinc finger protein 91-like [Phlebotomus argentipes]
MKSNLDVFLLNHRIFLVKHFYQFNGDCVCVKTKYESIYKSESPIFSSDVLMEIVSLFEATGSVFKPPDVQEDIEQIYVKVETVEEGIESDEENVLKSPTPEESTQINPFCNSGSDICNSSEKNSSDADTLSNEEFPLIPGCRTGVPGENPVWWDNPEDTLVTEDLQWKEESDKCQFVCNIDQCRRAFRSLARLAVHRISHEQREEVRKCRKCDKIFLEKYALKRHFRRKHREVKFHCQKCWCAFRDEKNYRNHLEEHELEPGVFEEAPESPELPTAPIVTKEKKPEKPPKVQHDVTDLAVVRKKRIERFRTCEVCGKICSTARYKKHTMTHSGERPIKCNICGKGFIYSCGYQKHLLSHQGIKTGVKRAMCEICGKKLTGEKVLEAHIRKIHERPEQEFKCKVSGCGRSYPNEKFLRRHMDRHSGKLFKCSFCNVEYKDKSQLKIHMDKVHLKTEPPQKCDVCGKGSWNIKDHRTHMRKIHKIEVPYIRKKPQDSIN